MIGRPRTSRAGFHLAWWTCLLISMTLVLLGALMATTYTKMRPVLDAAGQQVFREDGSARYEVDPWATFWNGWPTNVPLMLALVFFSMAVVKVLKALRRMWRRRGGGARVSVGE